MKPNDWLRKEGMHGIILATGLYDLRIRSVRVLPSEGVTAILALGAIKGVCGRPWHPWDLVSMLVECQESL